MGSPLPLRGTPSDWLSYWAVKVHITGQEWWTLHTLQKKKKNLEWGFHFRAIRAAEELLLFLALNVSLPLRARSSGTVDRGREVESTLLKWFRLECSQRKCQSCRSFNSYFSFGDLNFSHYLNCEMVRSPIALSNPTVLCLQVSSLHSKVVNRVSHTHIFIWMG